MSRRELLAGQAPAALFKKICKTCRQTYLITLVSGLPTTVR